MYIVSVIDFSLYFFNYSLYFLFHSGCLIGEMISALDSLWRSVVQIQLEVPQSPTCRNKYLASSRAGEGKAAKCAADITL